MTLCNDEVENFDDCKKPVEADESVGSRLIVVII